MNLIPAVWYVISPCAPHLDIIAIVKYTELTKTLVKGQLPLSKKTSSADNPMM
jgi:hypothetical protein